MNVVFIVHLQAMIDEVEVILGVTEENKKRFEEELQSKDDKKNTSLSLICLWSWNTLLSLDSN